MARKPRIHLPGGFYHVIFRGNAGQTVFLSDEDRYRFYLLLQEGTCRFDYRVHAFCLMSNHIHLVLQAGKIPLSRGMQNLSFRFTRWVNWREKRMGHLFQGRYKAVLVDSDSYLLELVRYIHLNPVRAGLVVSAEDYPWSGHRAYLGQEILPWLSTDWVLAQFDKSVKAARTHYASFVLDGLGDGFQPEFSSGGDDSRILGNDRFVDLCLSGSGEKLSRVTAQDIVDKVCEVYAIDGATIQRHSQQRHASEARAVAGWIAGETGVTLSSVARVVNREVGSISSSVRRLTKRMQHFPELAGQVQTIKELLLHQLGNLEV